MEKNPKFILGIDPGLSGGLALVDAASGALDVIHPMPVSEAKWLSTKRRLDVASLADLLSRLRNYTDFAAIENVHAMPKQGVVSVFTFGEQFGVIRGILAALKYKAQLIEPSVWKAELNLSQNKNESLDLAKQLWAGHGNLWAAKKNDGLAESALIAYYCRKLL